MKKIFTKALSVFLAALMFLTIAPAFVLAADEQTTPAAPVFSLELVSETEEQAVIVLKLKENSFNSFDATITTTCQGLTLSKIAFSVDLLVAGASTSFNTANGKISFAMTDPVVAECDVVTYTYTKATGEDAVVGDVTASEFTVDFETCAISANDGTEANIDLTDSIVVENNLPTVHVHEPADSWVITKEATCSEEGTIVQYCKICGEIANSSVIEKSEHKNKKNDHKDATCTEAGYDKVICGDCGETLSETTIAPKNHPNKETEHKDATCTEAGYNKVICKDCGETISETTINPKNHPNKKNEHKDATCTEDGYDRVICPDCNTVISSTTIEKKGHGETEIVKKAPACEENGYIRTVCKDCGDTITETTLPKTGHNYIIDRKEATCTEDGYVRNFCPACQDVKSSTTLTKTGHKWLAWKVVEKPTYSKEGTERRICDNCGSHEDRPVAKLVANPTELVMSMQELGMNFKQTVRLFVTILPEEAAYSTDIIWESSDESVATVNEDGEVYATGLGNATITAKTPDGKVSATCEVTVKYSTIQWIIVYILFGWIWYV
ncbi:MAG: Ig domain-containing protein [Clostridia bacterium]|nr:Ig domain-containing protein [Clostridia bacterium]